MLYGLGMLVGLVLGLTGAGGGILAVPALMVSLGWSVSQASPVALFAVAGAAWVGALDGLRRGLARYRAAFVMALAGLPFTWLGLALAEYLPPRWLQSVFAGVMLLVAWRLLRGGAVVTAEHDHALCRVHRDTGRLIWTPLTAVAISGFGALAGLLTGLLGVGGGFIIVPVLRRFTELSLAAVVATSLMVVALVSSLGIVVAWLHGASLQMAIAVPFLLAVMVGMVLGRMLSPRLSLAMTLRAFALVLLAVAISLLLGSWLSNFGV